MASFEDIVAALEAELDREEADELAAEVADRIRGELARTTLVQRLRPVQGRPIVVALQGLLLRGDLTGVGPDWLLVRDHGQESVVPLSVVLWVEGLARASAAPGSEGRVAARTSLGMVLRRLVRDRADVTVVLADGSAVTGVLDRVGPDHLELAMVPAGEARRASAVTGVRAVPLAAVLAVRRQP